MLYIIIVANLYLESKNSNLMYRYFILVFVLNLNFININNAQSVGFDYSGMDKKVVPGDDFNAYVNGKWINETEIPGDQSRWGSFSILIEDNNKRLRGIMEEASALPAGGSVNSIKIGSFYLSAMDTFNIEKLGATPVLNYLRKVDMINSYRTIMTESGNMHTMGLNPFFSFYVGQDDKNSAKIIAQFGQPRLGLPEKGYYLDNDANKVKIRKAYANYIESLFVGAGYAEIAAKSAAKHIIELETKLASASKSAIDLRDPETNYHKISKKELYDLAPNIEWDYLQKSLLIEEDSFIVGQPEYFKALSEILIKTPITDLKDYLKLKFISSLSPYLSKSFQDISFNFSKEFSGQKFQAERGKRMVNLVNGKLGFMVGELYVAKYFPPQAKARMLELVKNLQVAYEARINAATWMDSKTKEKAVTKLKGMLLKIGYPDKWKDYSSLQISKTDLVQNVINSDIFEYKEMIAKLGKPVDKSEWHMTPAIVNAYYNPQTNEIAFPAGILQPPFFNMDADDAINYGGIGAVIGHEMTHGFDDSGRLYDVEGNLGDWWTPNDAKSYKERSDKIVAQYDQYTVYDTVHVKGLLTLGENIADLGGLSIAYDAFHNTDQYKKGVSLDGYTPDQRFFLGFGQIWRSKGTKLFTLTRINTDPHSPEQFRIRGSLSNFTPWYQAFNVKPSNNMYRPESERVKIW